MFRRKRNRVKMVLPVRVVGHSAAGASFDVLAHTLDIAVNGARLGGMERLPVQPGDVVEIRRKNRRAAFKVMWVGQSGTPRTGHVGVRAMDAARDFWGVEVPVEGEVPLPLPGQAATREDHAR